MRPRGFTYVGLLLAVALAGTALAVAGTLWSTDAKREKEAELLFVGNQFREAIGRYYEGTPGRANEFPRKLEDLLEDKRVPVVRRHLRKIYPDPMTGKADWVLIKGPGDRIIGVRSSSDAHPLKVDNFLPRDAEFANKKRVSEWAFEYDGTSPVPSGGAAPKPASPKPASPGPATIPVVPAIQQKS